MRKTFVAALVAAFMVVGLVAYGTNVATDVPNDHTFHDDITWMFENDISRGCNPPQNNAYCPEDFVTRGQMSAFFHRYHNMFGGGGDGQGPQGPQGPPGPAGAQGEQGPQGEQGVPGLANLSTDGPYPGETQLSAALDDGRANSDAKWSSGSLNVSWVRCADDKAAIGGGFRRGDAGEHHKLNIVSSHPAYIDSAGVIVSEVDAASIAINLPDDWAFVPNAWVVEGFYDGAGEVVVRPFVTCATVGE